MRKKVYMVTLTPIRSVHPSESVTIAVFQREPAGEKEECFINKC